MSGNVGTSLLGLIFAMVLVGVAASPRLRCVVVTSGVFLVFQSSSTVGKVAYLAILVVALVVSFLPFRASLRPLTVAERRIVIWSTLWLIAISLSWFLAAANFVLTINWFRDSLGYALLGALPIVAVDLSRSLPASFVGAYFRVLGAAASLGLAFDWLSRRGASDTVSRFVLSSTTFVMLALLYFLSRASMSKYRALDTVLFSVCSGSLILSGSRTNLALLLVGTASVFGRQAFGRVNALRLLQISVPVFILGFLLYPVVFRILGIQQNILNGRRQLLENVLGGRLRSDQSFEARSSAYELARSTWSSHKILGTGPGYLFRGTYAFTLDTPWVVLAKLGLAGTLLVLVFVLVIGFSCYERMRSTTLRFLVPSWAVCMIVLTPFGPWLEDKGTAVVFFFLVLFSGVISREDDGLRAEEHKEATGHNFEVVEL